MLDRPEYGAREASMDSIWTAGAGISIGHPPLAGKVSVDVAVIGGGVTGLSTALMLREAGFKVCVLEAFRVGRGTTGGSTGNLYGTLAGGLAQLRRKWNAEQVRQAVTLRMEALEYIEFTIARHSIECGFERTPLHAVVVADEQRLRELEEELDAALSAGLRARLVDEVAGFPFPARRAMRIDDQAQFNPLAYAQALARLSSERGVSVYEGSAAIDVDAGRGLVQTEDGQVQASHVVFATHTPKGMNLVQAEMEVFREYGVAGPVGGGSCPDGIVWIQDHAQSIRRYRHDGRDHLVAVGEKHRTGDGEAGAGCLGRMTDYLQGRLDAAGVGYAWSAQQYVSADGLPYIGRSAHHNVLLATGFSADGLVWGTVAAAIITALVRERDAIGIDLLTPRRFTPVKSATVWARESASVVKHLVGDRLGGAGNGRLSEVAAGEGRIMMLDGHKLAVHRSAEGDLFVLSPVCPHMKCHVVWNPAESSWDCPCHGSRFRPDGSVIEGPAWEPLQRRDATAD
jgi:glycine/D-amino acid oxidase-like deaminating enzyme/nitrite reductase/ring-hydroxylating ferredoxin subunit